MRAQPGRELPAQPPTLMRVREMGRIGYVDAWQAMREFTARRGPDTADELWVLEHPPVYTLGLAGRREHLLDAGSIPVVASDRGGQVSYHGPGQLIVYTLVDLRRAGFYVRELVYRIEQGVIQTLEQLGVAASRVSGAPGIYVAAPPAAIDDARFADKAKIAALGIKVHRACSYHGVALNVAMDLAPFSAIDPCGYRGLRTIDLATLGVSCPQGQVAGILVERLCAHLQTAEPPPAASAPGAGRGPVP
jgi:lipoyl(octanoyl) transferase